MYLRQTRFGYEKDHFDKVVSVASNLVGRMETTGGLHSISVVKMTETEGQILAFYTSR